ncbi:MAG: hypothetical protein LQ351_005065 [Letrouitia transgressa]|nr:MAG: hypothetical protein LQ351_005065 [Letrouitia transgressa]
MAGLEQLEIHSKSYLVRWVEVRSEHTISWSIQPHKKSINFGIFKHPGPGSAPTPKLPSSTFEPPPTPSTLISDAAQDSTAAGNPSSAATEKLKSLGLRPISWYGAYEANRVSTGKYDVPKSEGGMYALVFDNTFAKQFSKSVTFVLLTYPTDCPPQANHHMHHVQGPSAASTSSLGDTTSSRARIVTRDSADSVDQISASVLEEPNGINQARKQRQKSGHYSSGARFFTGILYKRRRKRHQGYARRFFTLDFSSSTLSYYHNRHTLALRGAVPLSLAAVGANAKTREISIDSGAEVWHLKALNQKDFDAWKNALELARTPYSPASPVSVINLDTRSQRFSTTRANAEEEVEWERVEALVDRIHESRETARILAKDTDPKYLPLGVPKLAFDRKSTASSASESPPEKGLSQPFPNESDRRPFWKRKPSSEKSSLSVTKRSVSAQATSTPSKSLPSTPSAIAVPDNPSLPSHKEEGIHDHCMELLRNLESIVADFALLIEESKQRRTPARPPPISATSRYSLDTIGSEEFFDAESGDNSQLLAIQHESDDERGKSDQGRSSDEDSASEVEDSTSMDRITAPQAASISAFPPKPHSLTPLPHPPVQRREMVPPSTVSPPSLIGFFRKNVGKDLSTIAMPVSANEPLSLLQRASEQLEYSMLLDSAAMTKSSNSRLLQVAAFAVSSLSAARVKERAVRKPFNPMLGETYELVRPDRGFRFMSEKVSHRPVRMACQAESEEWTLTQAPMPTQKFWGKSAEIVTEGRVRVVLHSVGDRFSWTPATSFLRNMLAGEKYVEPVGTMTITNECSGEHAIVTFKSKGMFSGRSEDVVIQSFDSFGDELPLGLVGKWTSSLIITENGTPKHSEPPLWTTADLVPDVTKRYGFTKFAACLNEITHLESGRIAPTDSRLRPDQQMLEDGRCDQAEDVKFRLEEAQRQRRKTMEEAGEVWTPRWFGKVDGLDGGEEVWRLIDGEGGYWRRRERGAWAGGERVFDA